MKHPALLLPGKEQPPLLRLAVRAPIHSGTCLNHGTARAAPHLKELRGIRGRRPRCATGCCDFIRTIDLGARKAASEMEHTFCLQNDRLDPVSSKHTRFLREHFTPGNTTDLGRRRDRGRRPCGDGSLTLWRSQIFFMRYVRRAAQHIPRVGEVRIVLHLTGDGGQYYIESRSCGYPSTLHYNVTGDAVPPVTSNHRQCVTA